MSPAFNNVDPNARKYKKVKKLCKDTTVQKMCKDTKKKLNFKVGRPVVVIQ